MCGVDDNPHRLAEQRSLALHAEVARRLRERPELLDAARARVAGWLRDATVHPHYAGAWRELLDQPLESVCEQILGDDQRLRDLRQCTPFAGVIDPRTRWRIHRRVRERWEAR